MAVIWFTPCRIEFPYFFVGTFIEAVVGGYYFLGEAGYFPTFS